MNDIASFIEALASFFTPQIINFVGVVILTIVLVALLALVASFRRSEFFRQYGIALEQVDDVIFNAILVAGFADTFDRAKYTELAKSFNEQVDLDLSPEMYYVITRAQAKLEEFGYQLELLELYERAEGIYQTLKRDPDNGLDL